MNWHPISEPPNPPGFRHSALILCIDEESQYLKPGPVLWCPRRKRWIDERYDDPVKFTAPDTTYYWCYENDLINAAMSSIASMAT